MKAAVCALLAAAHLSVALQAPSQATLHPVDKDSLASLLRGRVSTTAAVPQLASDPLEGTLHNLDAGHPSFVELSSRAEAGKVHGFCEICIRMLQMKQHRLTAVCSGLSDTYYITCVKNLESLLRADRALDYWENIGCMHEDEGPEVVKPCPAHTVCGWVPNIFGAKAGATVQQGLLPPMCPPDLNFRSRVPKTDVPDGMPGDPGSGA